MNEIVINNPKNFIDAISLDNEKIYSTIDEYIFRGQSNSKWKILPSIFREDVKLYDESGKIKKSKYWSNRNQVETEFFMIEKFIKELNINGFHVPNEEILNINNTHIESIEFLTSIGRGKTWPTKEYLGVLSIAQHYGMPTRLIDFSYDPFVALYFAAKDFLEKGGSEEICIYALNKNSYALSNFKFSNIVDCSIEEKSGNSETQMYQIVNTPSYYNKNLKSQKALFLAYVHYGFRANKPFKPISVEKYLSEGYNEKSNYKFIIDAKYSEELLYLLEKRFYSISTLFPSIESCVKNTFDRLNFEEYLNRRI